MGEQAVRIKTSPESTLARLRMWCESSERQIKARGYGLNDQFAGGVAASGAIALAPKDLRFLLDVIDGKIQLVGAPE